MAEKIFMAYIAIGLLAILVGCIYSGWHEHRHGYSIDMEPVIMGALVWPIVAVMLLWASPFYLCRFVGFRLSVLWCKATKKRRRHADDV